MPHCPLSRYLFDFVFIFSYQGRNGISGRRGFKGVRGDVGPEGYFGDVGFKGERGLPGARGLTGLEGHPGTPGERGDPAPPPPGSRNRGFVFVRHSQTVDIPRCPVNTQPLWEGYSLASTIGSSMTIGQDLGAAGSCLQRFTTMPFLVCDINNICNYAQSNDDSIWLSTAEPMPMSMAPFREREIEKYISRCTVCETSTRVIALHSQEMNIPNCPDGWEELWIGYSYLMHTSDNAGGAGQNLISPGSCLEEFRAQPMVECHGDGKCNYYDTMTSFWLTTIDETQQFSMPQQRTLKADQTSKISRCAVCRKIYKLKPHTNGNGFPDASALIRGPGQVQPYPPQQLPPRRPNFSPRRQQWPDQYRYNQRRDDYRRG